MSIYYESETWLQRKKILCVWCNIFIILGYLWMYNPVNYVENSFVCIVYLGLVALHT